MQAWPETYILRHGQTEWNAQHRIQGGFDSPLTELGRHQALQQRNILGRRDLAQFCAFSSPQGRAFATAGLAVVGQLHDIRTDDRLVEIRVGEYEGRIRQELPGGANADFTEESALHLYDKAPGGEGFLFLFGRTEPFDRATLDRLYPGGPADQLARFEQAARQAVAAGFLLEADLEEILALAGSGEPPSGFRLDEPTR